MCHLHKLWDEFFPRICHLEEKQLLRQAGVREEFLQCLLVPRGTVLRGRTRTSSGDGNSECPETIESR